MILEPLKEEIELPKSSKIIRHYVISKLVLEFFPILLDGYDASNKIGDHYYIIKTGNLGDNLTNFLEFLGTDSLSKYGFGYFEKVFIDKRECSFP
jgi:hypothetical protein